MKKSKSIQAVIRRARAQGRAEAVTIISRLCPETGIDRFLGCSPNADAGDYSTYWDVDALRNLLCVDTDACEAIDRLRGAEMFAHNLKSDLAKSKTDLAEQAQAYYRLNGHNNVCESQLDEASALLDEIAKGGQVYRECTDKCSVSGKRIAVISASVSRFQLEAHGAAGDEAENTELEDWHMNPCKQGHRDVGAAGGIAHCYQCDEMIIAATTQEAFELWNAANPAAISVEATS